jgi:hypothetical protein
MAVRASGPITLDGLPDEAAWNDAPIASHFLQNDPREGEPATFDTEVRVVYDDDALYFGVDVKYGVTTGLVWDFTVNTDFSQVEADEQQVNLTRFSLFFPEKRDFFLENSGIFQFGTNSD